MENLNIENIQNNIFKLIDYTNIEGLKFANLLDISDKQFRLIKNNKAKFSLNNINKSCEFFGVSIEKINDINIRIEPNLREKLVEKHRNHSEFSALLPLRPSLKYIIRFELINNKFYNSTGLTVDEIRQILLQKNPEWNYSSRAISNAMLNYPELVRIIETKLVNGKKVNVYGPNKI